MTPTRLRFTVRRMLITVAALSVLTWLLVMTNRFVTLRREYEARSRRYWMANLAYDDVHEDEPGVTPTPEHIRWKAHRRAMRAYNGRLRRKYENAAARPWLPVEPDPPEPQ
jgi:hypothetical protein